MVNYTSRLFENMLNSMGTKLWKTFTNNLKSAYNEIKAIDDELVVVRRVTGKTNEELAGMSQNAMKVAQAYGIAASKYLSGVADFTRAGYQDQAEGLAELSVKLQRAGDVSADVANQYVLAIDKAYGLQGNIEALTAAMDGANQIGNEYATNVGEIAAGIGKIATIASTAHVGINELTAALGTITAVTQRSGTEAATALRAIFLNIMGDTTTEIEEGAKWTAGEIEGLRDVLELYAPEVVRAAEATGTLIDPMEAIGALAKSYQDGILTEAKLFSMVNDIGGKLRTNQLMVLIKNWDMYQSMLNTYANASGSIAKEVENSLDSITVKTERLKASWVALVNNTVSTGMIKGVLDGLNTAVQAVGNLGNALTIVLGLVTALKAQRLATLFAGMFRRDGNWVEGMTRSVRGLGAIITAVGVAISVVNGLLKDYDNSIVKSSENAAKTSAKATQSSNEILKLYSTFITAKEGTEEYTVALLALAEALGLTAEQASNAGTNIGNLTIKQLEANAAAAQTAVDELQGKIAGWKGFGLPNYFKEYEESVADIIRQFEGFYKEHRLPNGAFQYEFAIPEGWSKDAYSFIEVYEKALALKQKFSEYNLRSPDSNVTQLTYYKLLDEYLDNYDEQYTNISEAVTKAAESQADLVAGYFLLTEAAEKATKANADLADGTADAFSTEEIMGFVAALEALNDSYDTSTQKGKLMYKAVLAKMYELFPNLMKFSKEYNDLIGSDTPQIDVKDSTSDVKALAEALSTATKAKNAFDEAMKQDAENKGFTDYQSAYSAYAEEIKAGRVNSRRAMAAAEYLMAGSDEYDFAKIYAEKGYAGVNAAM